MSVFLSVVGRITMELTVTKYRVLKGYHTEGSAGGNSPAMYGPGEVVDSKTNLLEHNVRGQAPKFAAVDQSVKAKFEGIPETAAVTSKPVEDLEALTVLQLKIIAEEEEIEIDATMKKSEIINTINIARDLN